MAQGAKLAMGGEGRLSRDGNVGHFKRGGCLVAIRAGVPERASGELALHVLDIMQSTEESAASGEPIALVTTATPAPAMPDGFDPWGATL